MEILLELPNFPLSICTQDGELTASEVMVDASIVEEDDGFIKFLPYVDPQLIYLTQHNSSIGQTWAEHNSEFSKFIFQTEKKKILDIGGGSGNIYKSFLDLSPNVNWTIVDINPPKETLNLRVVKGLFEPEFVIPGDVVVTSHFIEHLFDLNQFLISLHQRRPSFHIFSLPNFSAFAKNHYCSTIMFEHPNFLAEKCLEHILSKTGWEILDRKYFKEHSIFFKTKPVVPQNVSPNFEIRCEMLEFISYIKYRVDSIKMFSNFYVFGAHFPFYYLLSLGIKESQIISVIDNDLMKQGKRMYGTNVKIISPRDVPTGANVFLEMGPYNDEIKSGFQGVNFI